MRILSKIYEFLLFVLSLAFAVFFVVHSFFVIYSFANSLDWQQVSAEVVSVKFVRHDDSKGRQDTYERKLVYKYFYDEKEFTSQSEHFGFGRFFSKPNTDYIKAQQIKVYVDPNAPEESVVYRFNLLTFMMQIILMTVLFGVAYLFRPKWLKNITRKRNR